VAGIGAAIGYGMQVFREAMGALIGLGSIQERLHGAHVRLSKAAFKPEHHLPAGLRSDFAELMESLSRAGSLDDDRAYALACQVRDMAEAVDRAYYEWECNPR
jgi:hypothetical protein